MSFVGWGETATNKREHSRRLEVKQRREWLDYLRMSKKIFPLRRWHHSRVSWNQDFPGSRGKEYMMHSRRRDGQSKIKNVNTVLGETVYNSVW